MVKGLCKEYNEGEEQAFVDDMKKVMSTGLKATTEMSERDGKKILKICATRKRDTSQIKEKLGWQ